LCKKVGDKVNEKYVTSWGRTCYSKISSLENDSLVLDTRLIDSKKFSIIGSLTSYGDSAINESGNYFSSELLKTIDIDFEKSTVWCGGGVSYEELLHETFKYRLIPEVIPGSSQATIGGAIAADAHGKRLSTPNCLSNSVLEILLYGVNGEIRIARGIPSDAPLWQSTFAGLGITGLILAAKIRLIPLTSDKMLEEKVKCGDVDTLLGLLKNSLNTHDYALGWIDLSRKDFFKGVVSLAKFTNNFNPNDGSLKVEFVKYLRIYKSKFKFKKKRRLICFIYRLNLIVVNRIIFSLSRKSRTVSLRKYLFPLERIYFWPMMHGREGLVQWQRNIPFQTEKTLKDLLEKVNKSKYLPTLVTIKILREESEAILGYCIPGWNLAIDFRAHQIGLREFLEELDQTVISAGGRPYLIKDDYLSAKTVEQFFLRYSLLKSDEFKQLQPSWVKNNQLHRIGLLD